MKLYTTTQTKPTPWTKMRERHDIKEHLLQLTLNGKRRPKGSHRK